MSTPPLKSGRLRNMRTVLLLGVLFFLPIVGAFALYYGTGWRPPINTHDAELFRPVRPLPSTTSLVHPDGTPAAADVLHRKWTLVYLNDGRCSSPQCRFALYFMRQTRLGLGKDMSRVQRVFLATRDCCSPRFPALEHAGLIVLDATRAQALLQSFPQDQRRYMVFVVDPLGNLVLRFDTRNDPKGLRTDMKTLLRLSSIG